jgi:hypothetical protein
MCVTVPHTERKMKSDKNVKKIPTFINENFN